MRRLVGPGAALLIGLGLPLQGPAVAAPARQVAEEPAATQLGASMQLLVGKSTLLRLPSPVERLSVGNPGVVDMTLINAKELYLLGKSSGSTNLILWNKAGQATIVDVTVRFDLAPLSDRLALFMPEEKGIRVDAAGDSIVLSGTVSSAPKVNRALEITDAFIAPFKREQGLAARAGATTGGAGGMAVNVGGAQGRKTDISSEVVNMLSVAAPQQVMLEVKIAEINRTLAEKLGLNFSMQSTTSDGGWTKTFSGIIGGKPSSFVNNKNFTQKIGPGDLRYVGPLNPPLTFPVQVPGYGVSPLSNLTVVGGEFDLKNQYLAPTLTNLATQDFFSWLIDAEKKDGLVKILAEPNIVAISGQEGSFLAGGEIMIPVPQSDGKITLDAKQFGVGLKFTPTVLEEGRIGLRVMPEVTDLVGFTTVAGTALGASVVVPTFTTRRVSTTVELKDGQSLAIGGLLRDNVREQVTRFPVLGELPVIGALFRSSEFQKDKTELLIVVTPRLVKPLNTNYLLPTDGFTEPSRSEFFYEGRMEGSPSGKPPGKSTPAVEPAGGFEMK